jgi:2-polyprenyl-3-methyl-5-hydroxy-6-metoxy-1,4-benzoquinol methylase
MTNFPKPLAIDESIVFWDERHQRLANAYAGGDVVYDDTDNAMLNALRVGRLIDLIGTFSRPAAPLRILDAGCGTGWLTRTLASFGHQVDGIDTSTQALATCRGQAAADGRDRYGLSRLDEWAPGYLYDVVVSVDVLFHIMEDDVWSASVRNLGMLVRSRGRLIIADHDLETDHLWGDYQVSRARQRYVDLLAPDGFIHRGFVAYAFRDNRAGFHVFDRTS